MQAQCPKCNTSVKAQYVNGVPSCPLCGDDLPEGAKAGARHSKADRERLAAIKAAANDIHQHATDLGAADPEPDEKPAGAKGEDVPETPPAPVIWGAVKAAGDWMLDVLGIPFNSVDSQGEWFTANTKLHLDQYTPVVIYYHSFTPDGIPQGEPVEIGKVQATTTKSDGVWFRVLLDKAQALAQRIWAAAQKGTARASSGTILHMRRPLTTGGGAITNWPVVELSLIDEEGKRRASNKYAVALPALKARGITLPNEFQDDEAEARPEANSGAGAKAGASMQDEGAEMEKEMQEAVSAAVKQALPGAVATAVAETLAAQKKADADAAATQAAEDQRVKDATEAAVKKFKDDWARDNRLPFGATDAPHVTQFSWMKKYNNLEPRDLAFLIDILSPNKHLSEEKDYARGPQAAIKALAIKLESEEARTGRAAFTLPNVKAQIHLDNREMYADAVEALQKMLGVTGIKANELDTNAQTGYGVEFVGVAYSTSLWYLIRQDVSVGKRLMDGAIEIPQGVASIKLPVEGADPTWYKVAQTTDLNATTGRPDFTVTASKLATAVKTLTPTKAGARVVWAGEIEEDSLIPWVANLRRQLEVSGLEQFTSLVIDGDTVTSSSNINNANGSTLSTNLFLLFSGFRKSPLVTTTAASRSAGGTFIVEDFLSTAKLMGTSGLNAIDKSKVSFLIDINTMYKALTLPEVKTRDVNVMATIEDGNLTRIFGYDVVASAFMHYPSAKRMANTSGKIDVTDSSNTTGSILAVRWDQWQVGYKRRVTIETSRFPESDASQIVAMYRVDMAQRDTMAASISYNVGIT